jgi:hypothetical protein
MSISSLSRSIASPTLREPVAPTNPVNRSSQATQVAVAEVDLKQTQVIPQSNRSQPSRVYDQDPNFTQPKQKSDLDVADKIKQFQDSMQRNGVKFDRSGPLSQIDLTIVDRVNDIDFEREIPSEELKERLYEIRSDFLDHLKMDTISFDPNAPLSRMVIVIKENINSTEFVRHLPKSFNDERMQDLMSFASSRGFDLEEVA